MPPGFYQVGRCAQIERTVADPSGDQARVLKHPDPHHKVISVFDQMNAAVIEIHINDNLGISFGIHGNGAAQEQLAKGHRNIDPQSSRRAELRVTELVEKAVELVITPEKLLGQPPCCFGRHDASRRPVEQNNVQPLLKPLDLLADGGAGYAELICRADETALPDDSTKYIDTR